MSTRTRVRRTDRSYTDRLRQRSAAPRHRHPPPPWLTGPHGPASLAVTAELGHLFAVLVEWPAATARGVAHVLVAATLGLVAAAVYFGPRRPVLAAGIGVGTLLPAGWLVTALAGVPLYRDLPPVVAATVTGLELALAAWLAVSWWAPRPAPSNHARGGGRGR